MADMTKTWDRRTGVDIVTSHLYEEIVSLRLLPGSKISEAEIATRFGVSRQPVRDAFTRLANMDLLLIRPQKATEVKRFSNRTIEKARFVRATIEAEVLRRAATHCDSAGAAALDAAITAQKALMENADFDAFGQMDYDFHRLLCEIAGTEYAFDVIRSEKSKLDRLCMLALSKERGMPLLIEDHAAIARHVIAHDPDAAVAAGKLHLSRLDSTIAAIREKNSAYFDPDEEPQAPARPL
ncbi:GntR family transcriptional regulator [Citreicella sp. C3M06]|uniref:GntR family transcriptional regulator n=1 Tax=Roseobacteraceae TaxID=2854170 RepID=UPI001C08D022|nr:MULTISPECIES: GntR family transcriptional regulator [Roseobacteraceae]MBU2961264.1 GntR family transcriptional regulator [Citreicella sp. C3M06]MDO6585107.1 GntR family transcriptional regulator [Salipiger sp. 1_MG-2023]